MGGDLAMPNDNGKAPTFLGAAMRDPFSGNLDRIQIIKGWSAIDGTTHEKANNAAWTDPDFDSPLSAFYYVRILEIPNLVHVREHRVSY